jgi:hypothetical protein
MHSGELIGGRVSSHAVLQPVEGRLTVVDCADLSVKRFAMIRYDLRKRERKLIAAASSESDHWPGPHRQWNEPSPRRPADVDDPGLHVPVGSASIGKHHDVVPPRRQEVYDLPAWRNRGTSTVDPNGEPIPGAALVKRTAQEAVMADPRWSRSFRKLAEGAPQQELIGMPTKADQRCVAVFEEANQL